MSNTFSEALTKCGQAELIASSFQSYILTDLDFTPSIVRDAIRSPRPSLGSGYDGIPSNAINFWDSEIHILLSKIFNLSFDSGTFPHQWKTSYITLYFKR